ncbi:decarboxylating NADP(+)-dependent phosphogluconate dehydrogenase [Desulfurivibrio alkaliphilus]|uniref:6-phosphogluconate dehydrogenase, decarboxylating n=1 Tax=Desulfurivibrio alkaliphilus (strain DSM 19089 / UNIQEM U267 / AHT2) TaxID=589865 RepID=D6Z307_DESAT|nr:decarboxylating NADP(+)-dependent phosphogluconate dehydrogenase [Desulfurivibrio alkaliphilus]ADH85932.1 6-phosphogluconate dehydrogenase, decarboxylating [Desulfurivibrio alkaliphilus AHT 2]
MTQEVQADIGLIGLAVMGQNLVLNMHDHGYKVAVYNRTTARVDEFLAGPAAGTGIIGTHSLEELSVVLQRPRKVMLMVKAGAVVDSFIEQLLPHLEPGDVIIDGGNSLYTDSNRRTRDLAAKGILFVGTGISGGEEGARRGPSIMPGGNPAAWPLVKDIFQNIAARVGGEPCCDWVGEEGAGHFVKMAHNGIEYGDMQLICEAYDFLRRGLGLPAGEIADVFSAWNRGVLESYLMEISSEILGYQDSDGAPLVDRILDAAGQKGTGKWTGINALEMGVPLSLITEAVFARFLSAMKEERERAAAVLRGPEAVFAGEIQQYVQALQDALYAAKIVSYAQGYLLMRAAAREHGWHLNYGGIARMWRGGCIIRSVFLDNIAQAFDADPDLDNLLLADFFADALAQAQAGWRRVVARAAELGLPVPALSSALSFYDGYRSAVLSANLLQAQRDYFGAHTYERVDRPRGEFFHTDWTGRGGKVASSTYNA